MFPLRNFFGANLSNFNFVRQRFAVKSFCKIIFAEPALLKLRVFALMVVSRRRQRNHDAAFPPPQALRGVAPARQIIKSVLQILHHFEYARIPRFPTVRA